MYGGRREHLAQSVICSFYLFCLAMLLPNPYEIDRQPLHGHGEVPAPVTVQPVPSLHVSQPPSRGHDAKDRDRACSPSYCTARSARNVITPVSFGLLPPTAGFRRVPARGAPTCQHSNRKSAARAVLCIFLRN